MLYRILFLLAVGVWIGGSLQAQETTPDSTIIVEDTLVSTPQGAIGTGKPGVKTAPDTVIISKADLKHIPRKAALFSAALPGLGQIYNGKYWKLPIIYGGFATLGYFVVLLDDKYQVYRRALVAVQNNAPEENPLRLLSNGSNADRLQGAVQDSRRNRDFTIILIAGLYGLQIMDAIVDAHLIEFDINENLSLQWHPSATGGADGLYPSLPTAGMALTLWIK